MGGAPISEQGLAFRRLMRLFFSLTLLIQHTELWTLKIACRIAQMPAAVVLLCGDQALMVEQLQDMRIAHCGNKPATAILARSHACLAPAAGQPFALHIHNDGQCLPLL